MSVVPRSLLLLLLLLPVRCVLGGAKATLATPIVGMSNATANKHRQRICDRYLQVEYGEAGWRDALSGLELNAIFSVSKFFHYDDENGINETDPGIVVKIMDELAERANFTWRNSFAVSYGPGPFASWTEMLELYTELFDISVDYFDKSSDRLNRGIAFMDQWFDGNMLLIEKVKPPEDDSNKINYLSFLAPFEATVWWVTAATCIFSGLIFQLLEFLYDEREDRSLYQWFLDHQYLSAINFTQQFLYEPVTPAGRLFGFSMAFWAMVMGATYTANLASFFVDQKGEPTKLADIDEAIRNQVKICTWKGTNADLYIRKRYPQSIPLLVPKREENETYFALHTGECGVTIGAKATWLGYEKDQLYNPDCDLEWVGRVVEEVSSSFAVKADPAVLCTNLIRDVLNYHLVEMNSNNRTLEKLWENYYESNENKNNCDDIPAEGEEEGRRLLQDDTTIINTNDYGTFSVSRLLKGGGGGGGGSAAAAGGGSEEALSIRAMAGTFVLHAGFAAAAVLVGVIQYFRRGGNPGKNLDGGSDAFDDDEGSLMTGSANGHYGKVVSGPYPIGGKVLATGSCRNGNTDVISKATMKEQLQALHTSQQQLERQQEAMAQQMSQVVHILTKMDDHSTRSEKSAFASFFASA
ncbi:NMDA receptor subtype of glutamate-gated ion channels with high calcium permeability and voltage-dependent sensitivity to magnesium. Mediated by glycine. This protein plays a key role in synaptic plasticity [Seminavis robusta]|uniref:Ionotropic glutamate receptor C-terminal domain-containing protein n=1 Tax=Seminavis robusta TaxID=568900 RepID=A0A9N8DM29_9STRA|nr:NMDA receptor subtype of glutamate-gated ion channels with high calcium permeability and voltage-dependent sensitivity to magnesium. Mediated by glycine. This protein plays a key role in synaptic plasticity [Seminavis robusta]|eukprot:Sro217_g089690.1 NMDA receptor subtype of glutamate-gated ion channels with high calcium permeability and voltage-dependent sensitivity to magnesium. Mediated by glycine. This protein plays a key role in synaptic plasticity (639) ;mRNA; f:33073-35078